MASSEDVHAGVAWELESTFCSGEDEELEVLLVLGAPAEAAAV